MAQLKELTWRELFDLLTELQCDDALLTIATDKGNNFFVDARVRKYNMFNDETSSITEAFALNRVSCPLYMSPESADTVFDLIVALDSIDEEHFDDKVVVCSGDNRFDTVQRAEVTQEYLILIPFCHANE